MAGDHSIASTGTRYIVSQSVYEDLIDIRDELASIARHYLGAEPPPGWPSSPEEAALYFRRLSLEMYRALGACRVA